MTKGISIQSVHGRRAPFTHQVLRHVLRFAQCLLGMLVRLLLKKM